MQSLLPCTVLISQSSSLYEYEVCTPELLQYSTQSFNLYEYSVLTQYSTLTGSYSTVLTLLTQYVTTQRPYSTVLHSTPLHSVHLMHSYSVYTYCTYPVLIPTVLSTQYSRTEYSYRVNTEYTRPTHRHSVLLVMARTEWARVYVTGMYGVQ